MIEAQVQVFHWAKEPRSKYVIDIVEAGHFPNLIRTHRFDSILEMRKELPDIVKFYEVEKTSFFVGR